MVGFTISAVCVVVVSVAVTAPVVVKAVLDLKKGDDIPPKSTWNQPPEVVVRPLPGPPPQYPPEQDPFDSGGSGLYKAIAAIVGIAIVGGLFFGVNAEGEPAAQQIKSIVLRHEPV